MKKIKTESGFICEINPLLLDDMELIDSLAEIEENPLVLPKVIVKLLGSDLKKKLYDHVRAKDGRVPVEAISKELADIFSKAGSDLKN